MISATATVKNLGGRCKTINWENLYKSGGGTVKITLYTKKCSRLLHQVTLSELNFPSRYCQPSESIWHHWWICPIWGQLWQDFFTFIAMKSVKVSSPKNDSSASPKITESVSVRICAVTHNIIKWQRVLYLLRFIPQNNFCIYALRANKEQFFCMELVEVSAGRVRCHELAAA